MRDLDHPPAVARAQKRAKRDWQEGTILSFTTLSHPPAGFPPRRMTIALVKLADGRNVLGEVVGDLSIGQRVRPRMRLKRVTPERLRVYGTVFEPLAPLPVELETPFPGYILALTGPSGVGKTTVSGLLATKIGSYAAQVPILTTKNLRDGDEQEYRSIDPREFTAMEKRGEIVAATRIPSSTEKRWYGYRAQDIERIWAEGKVPVVVTEMHLLQGLARHYGRRAILSLGLLPPGRSRRVMLSQLLHRLRARGRDSEASIEDRIKNAERDLQFFDERRELFDHFIVNENLDHALKSIVGHVSKLVRA